jgi:hypothetical protein
MENFMFPRVFHPSGVGVLRRRLRRLSSYPIYYDLREGACYSSIVMLRCEARFIIELLVDSSIQREVCLYRRVARRIKVPPSSGCAYCSRD